MRNSRSPDTAYSLPYEVVYWDCEAPGYEASRIRYVPDDRRERLQDPPSAWRSDRRCRFPIEIGLRLEGICHVCRIAISSESGLSPSEVEVFVAGPFRQLCRMKVDNKLNGIAISPMTGQEEYVSSVFVRVGCARFAMSNNAKADHERSNSSLSRAILTGMSFKCTFVRLMLWEPMGSVSNPGRQISTTGIQVLGSALNGSIGACREKGLHRLLYSHSSGAADAHGVLKSVLFDLGIDNSLWQRPGRPPRESVTASATGAECCETKYGDNGMLRDHAGSMVPSAAAAVKTVQELLDVALSEDRFGEAEQLTLALERVHALGETLTSTRLAQKQAAELEDFDCAAHMRDDARKAEAWLRQTVRDASAILGIKRPLETVASFQKSAMRSLAGDGLAEAGLPNTGVDICSSRKGAISTGEGVALYHEVVIDRPQSSVSMPESLADEKNLSQPPWMNPTGQRAVAPWNALLHIPWPAGVQPESRTVFCHSWNKADEEQDGWCGRAMDKDETKSIAAPSAVFEPLGNGAHECRHAIDAAPGELLGTIVHLIAASRSVRRPGPVLRESAPFVLSRGVHLKEPLCIFSSGSSGAARENADGTAITGESFDKFSEGKVFACAAADATPCATQVINWIEDNFTAVWRQRRRAERAGDQEPAKMTAAAAAAPTSAEMLDSMAVADCPERGVLPNIVGAGGFATYLPLLEATVGLVPVSAACLGFPAQTREASLQGCSNCLGATGEVAAQSCTTAILTAPAPAGRENVQNDGCPTNVATTQEGPSRDESTKDHSFAPKSPVHLMWKDANRITSLAHGAVFRAVCLVAAQGLLDPVDGPHAAAACLAVSLLAQSTSPLTGLAIYADTGVSVGDKATDDPVYDPAQTVRLQDLRWGLELLLTCTVADAAEGLAPHVLKRTSENSPLACTEGGLRDELRTNNDDTKAGGSGNSKGYPTANRTRAARMNRATTTYRLVDVACRQPCLGPALVASILVPCILHLLEGRKITSPGVATSPAKDGRHGEWNLTGQPLRTGQSGNLAPEAYWRSSPAGRHGAMEAMAAGAINVLLFMVRHFPFIPLSDYSVERLGLAGEAGMAFERSSRQTEHLATRSKTGVKSMIEAVRTAAEALMLEIVLSQDEEGTKALMSALTSAGDIVHLHQIAADVPSRVRRNARRVRVNSRLATSTCDLEVGYGREKVVANGLKTTTGCSPARVEIRIRLNPPRPRDSVPSALSSLSAEIFDLMSTTDDDTVDSAEERMMCGGGHDGNVENSNTLSDVQKAEAVVGESSEQHATVSSNADDPAPGTDLPGKAMTPPANSRIDETLTIKAKDATSHLPSRKTLAMDAVNARSFVPIAETSAVIAATDASKSDQRPNQGDKSKRTNDARLIIDRDLPPPTEEVRVLPRTATRVEPKRDAQREGNLGVRQEHTKNTTGSMQKEGWFSRTFGLGKAKASQ